MANKNPLGKFDFEKATGKVNELVKSLVETVSTFSSKAVEGFSKKENSQDASKRGWQKRRDQKRLRLKYTAAAVTAALLIGGIGINSTKAYEFYVNGEKIGMVKEKKDLFGTIDNLKTIISSKDAKNIKIGQEIEFKAVYFASNEDITPSDVLRSKVMNKVDFNLQAYALVVDGSPVSFVHSQEEADQVLENLKEPYVVDDPTIKVKEIGFLENVEVKAQEIQFNKIRTVEESCNEILQGSEKTQIYKVQKGDTAWDIAHKFDMRVEDIEKANEGTNIAKLQIDQEIKLNVPKPFVSVKVVEEGTFEESIPYEIVYEETEKLYQGDKQVKVSGSEGKKKIVAEMVKVNGILSTKNIIKEEIIQDPKQKIVLKGTKARPKTMAYGSFSNPTRGKLTSRFGYRWGRLHTGIDIAGQTGRTIKAADGGKVVFSGWKGAYGKLVIIDHENGYQTYYAHNSSLLVNKGARVYKGQPVAKMGNTGRSTGTHVHFEVRVNGKPKNPLSYVSY